MLNREKVRTLPEANEFSPGIVKLRAVLKIASQHPGNREAAIEALRTCYFANSAEKQHDLAKRHKVQRTRAYNVMVGLKGYKLYDFETQQLIDTGQRLLAIDDDAELHKAFAIHILTNCHGLGVLDAVRDMQHRGELLNKTSLAGELIARGFHLPRATTHHTRLLQWLREAGIVGDKYVIDENALMRLTGVDLGILTELSALTAQQRAFLRSMRQWAELVGDEYVSAKEVVDRSELEHGSIFRPDQLRAQVFRPLSEAGWIELESTGSGRGGKSGRLRATEKLLDVSLEMLAEELEWGVPPDLRPRLNTPLLTIYADLSADDRHIKGIALELLAVRIAFHVGLTPLRFRERSAETGGAEVDLIAEGAHLLFSRWLFQCKNVSKAVGLSDLAKEVGMALLLRAHVIVMTTTGRFASSVQDYARQMTQTTSLQVVLIDGKTLTEFMEKGPTALMNFFHEEASTTMRLKRAQVNDMSLDDA